MSSGPRSNRMPKVGSGEPERVGAAFPNLGFSHSQPMQGRGPPVEIFSHSLLRFIFITDTCYPKYLFSKPCPQ